MVKHFIIMSSSYTDGTRIALDIAEEDKLNPDTILPILASIKKTCGDDAPISSHFVETQSKDWASVVEYDPFFKKVEYIEKVDEFSKKIQADRVLSGLDVANYILSKKSCTHLSLEKLVYFAYADYLCAYSVPLFQDVIYAFRHGPVIDSVYNAFRNSGYRYISPPDFKDEKTLSISTGELPMRSRILFAKDGSRKLSIIDKTIEKYGKYSAGYLVDLTHRSGSPWSHVDSSKSYQKISDDLILQYHHIEEIS